MPDLEIHDKYALLTLNGEHHNTLSIERLKELTSLLKPLRENQNIRAVLIVSNHDKFFVPGADVKEVAELETFSAIEFAKLGQNLFELITELPQIFIAAVNGYCMGGGLDFAMSCDVVIAGEDAIFSHPGVKHGIITGFGGNSSITSKIGVANALDILLTGKKLNAKEALKAGIADEVVPKNQLRKRATELAEKLSQSTLSSVVKELSRQKINQRQSLKLEKYLLEIQNFN